MSFAWTSNLYVLHDCLYCFHWIQLNLFASCSLVVTTHRESWIRLTVNYWRNPFAFLIPSCTSEWSTSFVFIWVYKARTFDSALTLNRDFCLCVEKIKAVIEVQLNCRNSKRQRAVSTCNTQNLLKKLGTNSPSVARVFEKLWRTKQSVSLSWSRLSIKENGAVYSV